MSKGGEVGEEDALFLLSGLWSPCDRTLEECVLSVEVKWRGLGLRPDSGVRRGLDAQALCLVMRDVH